MMKIIAAIILLVLPAFALANNPDRPMCFSENIAARKINDLPPQVRLNILDIYDQKNYGIADSGGLIWAHVMDYLKLGLTEKEYGNLPRARFNIAYKFDSKSNFDSKYIVFVQHSDRYSSVSYVYQKDKNGEFGGYPLPWNYFDGPVCATLTAIQNEVRNPSNFPKSVVDAILDESSGP
jgi:hypothetical protein